MRSLLETGAVRRDGERVVMSGALDRLAVPDTIEATILARVQRLDDSVRQLLEVASVIGRTVPFPLLRAVTGLDEEALGAGLRRLQAAEFLYETRVFPELEHTFKHALTQDVAYGSLAPDQRRALHARIVEAIEALYPDRLGEHLERLAYHATRGELWERALRYSRQAGDKAFDRSANREAVASWEQALAALAHLPESREILEAAIDIRLALRSALLQLGEIPRITGYLREAGALATALGDRRRLAWALTYMTITHLFAGDPGQALIVGEQAYALAEEVGDVGLRATARTPWGHAHRERGDHRRAVALFREAIDALTGDLLRERLGQAMPPSLYARNIAAVCLAELGEFAEAMRLGDGVGGSRPDPRPALRLRPRPHRARPHRAAPGAPRRGRRRSRHGARADPRPRHPDLVSMGGGRARLRAGALGPRRRRAFRCSSGRWSARWRCRSSSATPSGCRGSPTPRSSRGGRTRPTASGARACGSAGSAASRATRRGRLHILAAIARAEAPRGQEAEALDRRGPRPRHPARHAAAGRPLPSRARRVLPRRRRARPRRRAPEPRPGADRRARHARRGIARALTGRR